MKNILKYITLIAVGCLITVSCDYDNTNFENLSGPPNANATYYVQFKANAQSLKTAVDTEGQLIDIETTVVVEILGLPLDEDITINLTIDPSTTIDPSMYNLSSTSITIAAGTSAGSATFSTNTELMPIDVPLVFALTLDEGENNATAGLSLKYDLLRINFCPWTTAEMEGSYSGTELDGLYGGTVGGNYSISKIDDTHIAISGLGQSLYSAVWGEAVTAGDEVVFEYKSNGILVLSNQYLCQTDNVWDYYIGPNTEITWDGCNETFNIPWIFHFADSYDYNYQFETIISRN